MYRVDIQNKELQVLEDVKFADAGFKERVDIQEWLSKAPQIFGVEQDALLILSKELPVSGKDERGIRLDLLALDREGRLVVIELKRDEARGDIDWQAIKYAARCSKFSPEKIIELLAIYENCTVDEAKGKIIEHIEGEPFTNEEFGELFSYSSGRAGITTRIILVAREFHPDVCSAVAWLRDNSIDISCIKLKPYRNSNGDIYLTSERIIPLPEMSDYTEFRDITAKNKSLIPAQGTRKIFSLEKTQIGSDELKDSLRITLKRNSNLTPRLIAFLEILSDGEEHGREQVLLTLKDDKRFGSNGDVGQTGRYLSNISQFITKPNSGHLRQLIDFSGESDVVQVGTRKTNYKVRSEYKELLNEVLSEIARINTSN